MASPRLSHTDSRGRARMVDVGAKPETAREAVASATVRMAPATLALALGGDGPAGGRSAPKGDVLAVARLAALAALKKTADWIPLCHPVRLVGSEVEIQGDATVPGLRVRVTARAFDRTGVEMEAMVGAAAAALTIYDMVKGLERGVEIVSVRLEEKRGGRSGRWSRPTTDRAGSVAKGHEKVEPARRRQPRGGVEGLSKKTR